MSDRKARLAALAARAGRDRNRDVNPDEGGDKHEHEHEHEQSYAEESKSQPQSQPKAIKFRNYAPQDESLEKSGSQSQSQSEFQSQSQSEPPSKRIRSNQDHQNDDEIPQEEKMSELEQAVREAKKDAARAMHTSTISSTRNNGIGMNRSMTPKKVNWDLKRDIAKKMNRLERRTQKALVELLRLRLEQEAEREEQEEAEAKMDGNEIDLD